MLFETLASTVEVNSPSCSTAWADTDSILTNTFLLVFYTSPSSFFSPEQDRSIGKTKRDIM